MDSEKKNVKLMNADAVRLIARQGRENDYNRKIAQSVLRELDPEGVSSASIHLLHEHAQGVLVEPHYRCMMHIKLKDRDEPVSGLIDVQMDTFNSLRSIADIEAMEAGQYGEGKATR